ncbi:MAG: hypothetical protein WAQ52_05190 [Terriglobales bacterium]
MPRKLKFQLKSGRYRESVRTKAAKLRGLSAIRRVRRGDSRTLTAAARAEGTSVRTIKRLLPLALQPPRSNGRIRVRATDPYRSKVRILTASGSPDVMARGSRERDLAARHRTIATRVLRGKSPASALDEFRGKKVGGVELVSNYEDLRRLAQAGVLAQLDTFYVSPEATA